MAFLNTGQLWDRQTMATCYPHLDLIETLGLDDDQTQQIEAIQRAYEAKVLSLERSDSESKNEKINYLLRERNHRIIEVLSDHQQKMLNTYCTDLITLTDY